MKLDIANVEFHLKIYIKLDLENIEFYTWLNFVKIKFKKRDILLNNYKSGAIYCIVYKLRTNTHSSLGL